MLCIVEMTTFQWIALAAHCVVLLLAHSQADTDVLAEHEAEPQMQKSPADNSAANLSPSFSATVNRFRILETLKPRASAINVGQQSCLNVL